MALKLYQVSNVTYSTPKHIYGRNLSYQELIHLLYDKFCIFIKYKYSESNRYLNPYFGAARRRRSTVEHSIAAINRFWRDISI
ncbi:MAG: hypothetical protein GYA02_12050 [Clostridiaceae bacterium]|nr:hypothetical protein [Clostridiaceae bacterium]